MSNKYFKNFSIRLCEKRYFPIFFIIILVTILFLPAFLGWKGIFHDDQLEEFPRYHFVAENLKQGIIPLWDPQNWCGAIPFYARYYADTYYLPLWPFLLLANLNNLNNCYWMFILLPLFLHYIIAALGMYFFINKVLKCNIIASCFGALAYVYSPAFTYAYTWQQVVSVQTWIPWLLIAYVVTVRKCCLWKILLGGAIFALIITAAAPTQLVFLTIVWGSLVVATMFFSYAKSAILRISKPLIIAGLIAIVGLLLSSAYLLSIAEGRSYTKEHIDLTTEAALQDEVGSLPVPFLATILIPNMFGNITGFNMADLNPSHKVLYWEANMSSGIAVTLMVFLGFLLFCKFNLHAVNSKEKRIYAFVFFLLYVFAVLLMLGRHTPFYQHFISNIPVFNMMPRPIRYRYLQCFSTAILGALALDFAGVARFNWKSLRVSMRRIVWFYASFCIIVVALMCFLPFKQKEEYIWMEDPFVEIESFLPPGSSGGNFSPKYETINIKVFFSGPSRGEIRYADTERGINLDGGVLAGEYQVLNKGFYDLEVQIPGNKFVWIYQKEGDARIGSSGFNSDNYDGLVYDLVSKNWSKLYDKKIINFYMRVRNNRISSFFTNVRTTDRISNSNLIRPFLYLGLVLGLIIFFSYIIPVKRWFYFVAIIALLEYMATGLLAFYENNYSWADKLPEQNQRALGPSHSFLLRMNKVSDLANSDNLHLRVATFNPYHDNFARINNCFALAGYEMHPLEYRFKKSIELAYSEDMDYKIYQSSFLNKIKNACFLNNFSVGYFLNMKENMKIFKSEKKVLPVDSDYFLHINENPLPRVYTLDRIFFATEEEQLNNLVKSDLRKAVYVGSGLNSNNSNNISEDYIEHFNYLQDLNSIYQVSFDNPNKITLKSSIVIPSMMVFTEIWYPGWEATVNGIPAPIYRVNYCQRGIWLDKGNHHVEMSFKPKAMQVGIKISLLALVIIIFLFCFDVTLSRFRKIENE